MNNIVLGAPVKTGCILAQIQSCLAAMNSLDGKEAELRGLEQEMRQTEAIAKRFNEINHKVGSLNFGSCFLKQNCSSLLHKLSNSVSPVITKHVFANTNALGKTR